MFICGSLEPGRDGVGDYTRRLAGELVRQGHQAYAIALNDKHIEIIIESSQDADVHKLPILRIPSITEYNQSFKFAENLINDVNPDWISIQFVPYAFNNKGLPILFTYHLKKLIKKRKVHIMMHETWVGVDHNSTLKLKWTSFLQKAIIKKMIRTIKPVLIHTHVPTYQLNLEALSYFNVKPLPLFSNIPLITSFNMEISENKLIRIGFFSQVESKESIDIFLQILADKHISMGGRLEVLLMGELNERMSNFGKNLEKLKNYKGCIKFTGFLQPAELTKVLQSCTLGITHVPRHLIGKSGSVIAFITHGVPVAAPNIHYGYKASNIGFFNASLRTSIITKPETYDLVHAKNAAVNVRNEIELTTIAETFIKDLIS